MWQNYFEHNGKKHYTGTIFFMRCGNRTTEGTFVAYIPDSNRFVYRYINSQGKEEKAFIPAKMFYNDLISITDKIDPRVSFSQENPHKGWNIGWSLNEPGGKILLFGLLILCAMCPPLAVVILLCIFFSDGKPASVLGCLGYLLMFMVIVWVFSLFS